MTNPSVVVGSAGQQANRPSDPYLVKIRDLIYQLAGIFQPDNKLYFLEDRIARRLKALNLHTLREYYDCLTLKGDREAELRNLLNEITVGETCFFRNNFQIDALRKVVLPEIVEVKGKLNFRKLRIWSAGCSTGEEPHTLSIVLMEEQMGQLKGWSFEIVATDLNERSVAKCKEGIYGDYAMRNVAPALREKYFQKQGEQFRVRDEVRASINFSRLNLLDDSKMLFMKGMDVIFCANVLIYFDLASKRRVIQHFFNNLLPSGYFFLGHSESLFSVNDQFHLVHFAGATAYSKTPRKPAGVAK
ncbi:MAG: protein-glutamate O-methyltransferase CheR [Acidobacteria bacterium]|nr:protein-glutamate O-methyltransferase CheR [Acidobacteriota bacterium]MBI3662960.1 protein-glutamate O-methyltransferase CheR [Acidobacteriota bacterium]